MLELFGPRQVLPEEPGGAAWYDPTFLNPDEASQLFKELEAGIEWTQDHITVFGKVNPLPRLTAWYGDPGAGYSYSGIAQEPIPWTPTLLALRDRVGAAADAPFNSVLLNLYRDGSDKLAWHSDDERELGPRPTIASVSLGATRAFQLRRKDRIGDTITVDLESGSLLVMSGECQRFWDHQVPVRKRVAEGRINLTFRWIGF